MKKIVFLSLVALCLPWALAAQSVVDDLYYVPSKPEKAEKKDTQRPARETVVTTPTDEVVVRSNTPMDVQVGDRSTTVIVRDAKGRTRDVDEYNRRYEAGDYQFFTQNDTLYIDERPYDGLDGEWMGGEFNGSAADYEYATRIIRFRNPRYAISISSPIYFDVVYGLNTWDWNVYTDGIYAYAFPTFSNPLWWDWRFNSFGWWGYPYYGWHWGWNSWYDPWYWGGSWGWHHPPYWHHPWHPAPGWAYHNPYRWGNAHTARRSYNVRGGAAGAGRRPSVINGGSARRTSTVRRATTTGTNRRVVGTRSSSSVRRSSAATRSGVSSSTRRTTTYTRPSNSSTTNRGTATGVRRSSSSGTTVRRSTSTFNRGSSTSTQRSYQNSSSRATRSYSTPSRSSSSSRSSFSTGGGSTFRSSGSAVRSSGGSRSGGGSSRRR